MRSRVLRGGSFKFDSRKLRSTNRSYVDPVYWYWGFGFRLVIKQRRKL